MNKTFISIIVPVYNGEKSIRKLVEQLIDCLDNTYKLEIVLVDDCSRDDSKKECKELFKKFSDVVRFYALAKNVGEHNAVMTGLNMSKGDYAVIIDDDLQNPISEVKKIIEYIQSNDYDVVYTYYESKKHSLFRNLGSWFNDKVANIMLNKPRNLYLCSFKILNRFLIGEVIKYNLPFPYIDGIILQSTEKIGKVKVIHNERVEGQSGYTLNKLVSLWSNMFVNFSIIPLRFSIVLGFIFALIGFLFGVYTIFAKIYNPSEPQGYSALITAVTVFSGVQLICLGVLGEYIGRIFMFHNRKPQFTVREKYEK